MLFNRRTSRRVVADARCSSRYCWMLTLALLTGCSDPSAPMPYEDFGWEATQSWNHSTDRQFSQADSGLVAVEPVANSPATNPEFNDPNAHFWSFPVDDEENNFGVQPELVRLPVADDFVEPEIVESEDLVFIPLLQPTPAIAEPLAEKPEVEEPAVVEVAKLPPLHRFIPYEPITESQKSQTPNSQEVATAVEDETNTKETTTPAVVERRPVLQQLSEQQRLLAVMLQDCSSATTGALTDQRLDQLAKEKIRQAYAMAKRGGLYVARQELVEVLRMISQAMDAQSGTPERANALAAGLRALREAEDFAPSGTQLEAELDIQVLCASHRTPISKQPGYDHLLPRLMMDRYLRYAQLQLALSVAGEPSGSMALHALGKLSRQFGQAEQQKHQLAERHAIAYQQAALLAHNQNYLAAHELGVLLADTGHLIEARHLLQQVAARRPNAVVFQNLAKVEEKLGQQTQALANRDQAHRLTQQGKIGSRNIQWISPHQFSQSASRTPQLISARRPVAARPMTASSQPLIQPPIRR